MYTSSSSESYESPKRGDENPTGSARQLKDFQSYYTESNIGETIPLYPVSVNKPGTYSSTYKPGGSITLVKDKRMSKYVLPYQLIPHLKVQMPESSLTFVMTQETNVVNVGVSSERLVLSPFGVIDKVESLHHSVVLSQTIDSIISEEKDFGVTPEHRKLCDIILENKRISSNWQSEIGLLYSRVVRLFEEFLCTGPSTRELAKSGFPDFCISRGYRCPEYLVHRVMHKFNSPLLEEVMYPEARMQSTPYFTSDEINQGYLKDNIEFFKNHMSYAFYIKGMAHTVDTEFYVPLVSKDFFLSRRDLPEIRENHFGEHIYSVYFLRTVPFELLFTFNREWLMIDGRLPSLREDINLSDLSRSFELPCIEDATMHLLKELSIEGSFMIESFAPDQPTVTLNDCDLLNAETIEAFEENIQVEQLETLKVAVQTGRQLPKPLLKWYKRNQGKLALFSRVLRTEILSLIPIEELILSVDKPPDIFRLFRNLLYGITRGKTVRHFGPWKPPTIGWLILLLLISGNYSGIT